jgi:hypothetical protein
MIAGRAPRAATKSFTIATPPRSILLSERFKTGRSGRCTGDGVAPHRSRRDDCRPCRHLKALPRRASPASTGAAKQPVQIARRPAGQSRGVLPKSPNWSALGALLCRITGNCPTFLQEKLYASFIAVRFVVPTLKDSGAGNNRGATASRAATSSRQLLRSESHKTHSQNNSQGCESAPGTLRRVRFGPT